MGFRVVAATGPVGAALGGKRDQGAPGAVGPGERGRGKEWPAAIARQQPERLGMQLGREIDDGGGIDILHVIGGRPGGERLGGRIPFARHVAPGHPLFHDRPDRRAGFAVQDIEEALLAWLGQRLHDFSVVGDIAEDRGAGHVAIPDVVMDHLIMPAALAGFQFDRDDAIAEQGVALAANAGLVRRGDFDAQIGQPQFLIDRYLRPAAGVGGRLGLAGADPAVVAVLALQRDGVEDPEPLARLHVEAADITLGARLVARHAARGMGRPHDHHIARHGGCGMQADLATQRIDDLVHIFLEIDHALVAEVRNGKAGTGIQRHQLIAGRDIENALLRTIGPIGKAAAGILARGNAGAFAFVFPEHPEHLAISGINADHIAARTGGGVEPPLDDQGRGLPGIFRARSQHVGR